LKSKCSHRQEFVVGGFVPSSADPQAVGSLVLGVHDEKGGLRHVGRVGTGFTRSSAAELFSLLTGKERKTRPFVDALDAAQRRDVRFVRADTVVEVEFAGWTGAGHLRHAAYRGIREDKPAKDIVAETGPGSSSDRPSKRQPGMGQQENGAAEQIVKLTHPDKLYWPADGIAKGDLAQYYADIWRVMGPLIVNRPLSLLRGPDGIGADMFYQKHGWRGMHKAIRTLDGKGARGSKSATESLVWIDGLDGLLGLVQGGALEIHPWGATLNDIEKPDMLTMDIDPDMGLDWPLVAEAALDIKERLEAAGLAAFVKTSGGKGLHVVSPLKPSVSWPQLKAFTKSLAQSMAGDRPERYVATVSKAKRRGKILIDYLRNGRGATAVAAYSTRARPHAPVSMPLGWDEITDLGDAAAFTLSNVRDALADRDHDPWADFEAARRPVK
jgi:bifunctional non-homologous end joining protein LigD